MADCTSRKVHHTKITHRIASSVDSLMLSEDVAEAARTMGIGRKSRHLLHRLYHKKWPAPSASCALMIPKVAGRAQ
eukprot:scaffold4235_cov32-Tisochrysis_lutea.AAC.3